MHGLIEISTPEKHFELYLFNHVSFGILIESLKLFFFHRRFEVCKCKAKCKAKSYEPKLEKKTSETGQ